MSDCKHWEDAHGARFWCRVRVEFVGKWDDDWCSECMESTKVPDGWGRCGYSGDIISPDECKNCKFKEVKR